MSKYTTEVRFICEAEAGLSTSVGYNNVNQTIQQAIPKIFDFDFPMYDEDYRNVLETKILKHYYTQEIGLETYGLWKLALDTKLNEIMPYYNEMYKSTLLDFDPLTDTNYTDTRTGGKTDEGQSSSTETANSDTTAYGESENNATRNGTNTTKYTGTDVTETTDNRNSSVDETIQRDSTDKYSDTPQGSVSDVNLQDNAYLTNARIISEETQTNRTATDTGTGTSELTRNTQDETTVIDTNNQSGNYRDKTENTSSTENSTTNKLTSTEEYVNKVVGKRGGQSYASMVMELRNSLINVDMLIIDELSDLFMQLW